MIDVRYRTLRPLKNGDSPVVLRGITSSEMKTLLADDWRSRSLRGAHWFRDAARWYRMNFAFNNPYNVGTVHSELQLIENHRNELSEIIDNHLLVFLGVGTGDTEMAIVNLLIERGQKADVIGIDINAKFLEDFGHSVRLRLKEDRRASTRYVGLQNLFERVTPLALSSVAPGMQGVPRCFICLGNTIGNYDDPEELLRIISSLAAPGDLILLGYQLNTHINATFEKYRTNGLLRKMLEVCIPRVNRHSFEWKLDKRRSRITAWCGDVEVFRSMKFPPTAILRMAGQCRLKTVVSWQDLHKNAALTILSVPSS
jgi:hypothetical protein